MNRYHKIMEKFWLLIAILSLAYAAYKAGQNGVENTLMLFLLPVIAGLLFGMRYFVRKKFEKMQDKD